MFTKQLQDQLYAKVLYPNDLTELMRGADTWKAFCGLPREVKMKFAYENHQIGRKDPGYKERHRATGREDKNYFHYTGRNEEYLQADGLYEYVQADETLRSFFSFAKAVFENAQRLVIEIAKDVDTVVPGLFKEVLRGKDDMTMRFLHYVPKDPTDMSLADAHIDRGGYTLHLYESHPGLELLTFDGEWIPAPMGEGHTIVFSGWQLEQKSKNDIRATWHRVRRIPGVNDVTSRTAIIFFVPFKDTVWYPKDDRFQTLTPEY